MVFKILTVFITLGISILMVLKQPWMYPKFEKKTYDSTQLDGNIIGQKMD